MLSFRDTHRIIWLDAFIGQDGEYCEFKRRFCTAIEAGSRYGDPLDTLIAALNENAAPFVFVHTTEQAIEQIEFFHDKHIIFISSGSLGQLIIPTITAKYAHVYFYYLFCGKRSNYIGFARGYRSCLQIFDHEVDLLVRLTRDLSLELIKKGEAHLQVVDPEKALEYFKRSLTLENTANHYDQELNGVFLDHLRLLNGHGNDIGWIQKAQNMIDEFKAQHTESSAPIQRETLAEEHGQVEPDVEEKSSQEEG